MPWVSYFFLNVKDFFCSLRKQTSRSMLSETINDISGAIQLALGPVFLLTGIAGMLNVMSGRLSRIIDRGRTLMEK
ncbi:MAG: DUF2721 domain-containing protein, partial [Saprospiraceae bacterium]